jgi:hypothetical protein
MLVFGRPFLGSPTQAQAVNCRVAVWSEARRPVMLDRKPHEEEDEERDSTTEDRSNEDDFKDQDLGWEEEDPVDRRKDPLRRP